MSSRERRAIHTLTATIIVVTTASVMVASTLISGLTPKRTLENTTMGSVLLPGPEATQLATSYIPAVLASELPVLSAAETGPGGIYDRLEEAGYGPIRWTEAITSRMPGPVEARLLRLPPGVPLLRILRLAASPAGQALEVNDTRVNAEAWEISYPIARHASTHRGRDASTHA